MNDHLNGGAPPGNVPGGSTGTLRRPMAPSFAPTHSVSPTDIIVLSDSHVKAIKPTRADVITLSDLHSSNLAVPPESYTLTPADTIILGDVFNRSVSFVRSVSDNLVLTDFAASIYLRLAGPIEYTRSGWLIQIPIMVTINLSS
mgnify:CR=1 FL=1